MKILQSDRPREFLHLTQQPDFPQTCGFKRIIKVIVVHDLNQKNLHINGLFLFCKIQKTLFLRCFQALSLEWHFFSQKSSSVSFSHLKYPNFMKSFRKIISAILEKMCLHNDILTYWKWWNYRIPFCLLGLGRGGGGGGSKKHTPEVLHW